MAWISAGNGIVLMSESYAISSPFCNRTTRRIGETDATRAFNLSFPSM
jgi:hypothetical protein